MINRTFPALAREPFVSWVKPLVQLTPLQATLKEKLLFLGKMGYWPDFENPRSYSEKINWRKLYSSNEMYVKCSDKLTVRDYVREKIGEQYLIPVLYDGESITPEKLYSLGDDIVVKANHDSGSVRIIRKNSREEAEKVSRWINKQLESDFGATTNQWWYSKIPPRVYIEKYLEADDGGKIPDLKFFVFKRPSPEPPMILIEVDYERGTPEQHRTLYDVDRKIVEHQDQDVLIDEVPSHHTPFPDVGNYDELIKAVLTLAEDFDHVRIDMYHTNGRNFFGEMTFSDGGGRSRTTPRDFDHVMGEYWSLNREPGGSERPSGIEARSQKSSKELFVKSVYRLARQTAKQCLGLASAAADRFLRFLALPYAVACLVDWKECDRNPLLVFWDHLYLFFALGYFPDNYASCRLWEKDRKDWKYYFGSGYDPRSVRRRHRHVLRPDCTVLFEDKEVCYRLCQSFDLPLPAQYGAISPEENFAEAVSKIYEENDAERLVIKLIDGAGGKGTCIVDKEANGLVLRRFSDPLKRVPLEEASLDSRAVVQEWVKQHPDVSGLSAGSLNTIRMVTVMSPENEVIVAGAYIRIGIGSSFLDSGSQVGVRINIESGQLGDNPSDGKGRSVDFAPAGYNRTSDAKIPFWKDVLGLAHKVQECFAPFNRFIGMDIGISEDGPVLVEINDIFDCARFENVTGPLLKNKEVLESFKTYGLLTHRRLH
jgi:hypothetical protein